MYLILKGILPRNFPETAPKTFSGPGNVPHRLLVGLFLYFASLMVQASNTCTVP